MSAGLALLRRRFSFREPGGATRFAAFGLFLVSLCGSAIVVLEPAAAQWAGMLLLGFTGIAAGFLLFALWPPRSALFEQARHAAEAAAVSNVAWAITESDGSVLDCNIAYRFLAGTGAGEPPAPPQLAFPGEGPASALYRLARAANEGRAREENFESESGQRLSAAVRPLKRGETCWWFTPRLPDAAPPKGVTEKRIPSPLIRFSDFFRNTPMGVGVTGADGTIVEANAVFERFFGVSGAAVGGRFGDMILETERGPALERIAQAASGEAGQAPVEIHSAQASSPSSRSAQLFASPFMAGPEGEPRAIVYVVDTSEHKALETKYAQAQKMQAIGQLAGGVAHDFNNLLQAIIGNCDLLLMRHSAGDPSFAEINEVRQNSVRAAGLVRQLLAFSRQQTLQPKVISLSDTLNELLHLLRRLVGERMVVGVEHARDLWPVKADEGQISNAVMNLVVNARDAMPSSGGTITIRTANINFATPRPIGSGQMPAGDYVLIDVNDSGTGIPKEHFTKIFEPFFTTKPVGQGTGLGLSTVYGIVKQTGGFITLDSEIGLGTTFHIYLPRHVPSSVPESVRACQETTASHNLFAGAIV